MAYFMLTDEINVDSPHLKALRCSGLTIHALEDLAVMGNQTPDLQMAGSA